MFNHKMFEADRDMTNREVLRKQGYLITVQQIQTHDKKHVGCYSYATDIFSFLVCTDQ